MMLNCEITIPVLWIFIIEILFSEAVVRPGRHVCPVTKMFSEIVPMKQTYKKPFYHRNCGKPGLAPCKSNRVYYRTATRTVFYKRLVNDVVRACCPGWRQKSGRSSYGCMQPECTGGCENGGTCVGPETCSCPIQFTGSRCDIDVDECLTRKHTCQHTCKNTFGNYECVCYEGFRLTDGRNCEFCPLCLPAFEQMMNQVNNLQNRVVLVETEKEELRGNFSILEGRYQRTINAVDELKQATIVTRSTPPATKTTTTSPEPVLVDQFGNPYKLDIISSLSEQISMLEERLADCSCGSNDRRRGSYRSSYVPRRQQRRRPGSRRRSRS